MTAVAVDSAIPRVDEEFISSEEEKIGTDCSRSRVEIIRSGLAESGVIELIVGSVAADESAKNEPSPSNSPSSIKIGNDSGSRFRLFLRFRLPPTLTPPTPSETAPLEIIGFVVAVAPTPVIAVAVAVPPPPPAAVAGL